MRRTPTLLAAATLAATLTAAPVSLAAPAAPAKTPAAAAQSVDRGLGPGLNRCLLYTSPSPRDKRQSRMPSSA